MSKNSPASTVLQFPTSKGERTVASQFKPGGTRNRSMQMMDKKALVQKAMLKFSLSKEEGSVYDNFVKMLSSFDNGTLLSMCLHTH